MGLGPTTQKKQSPPNHLWIDGQLDHHQNEKKCGIVKKDDAQTPNNKILFVQSHCLVQIIFAMSICRNKM